MKALVFGSLNIDYVYEVEHFVQPGETLSSENLRVYCGGKGLNQSIALSRSGVETWHAGAVGIRDGEILTNYLRDADVHVDLIMEKEVSSGHAIIQKTPDGENSIILFGGANLMITEKEADFVLSHFDENDYLVLQNEINQIPYIIEKAHEKGMKIVLNPSPMNACIFELPLSYVDYLILNEIEGAAMTGHEETDSDAVLNCLAEMLPDTHIILTLGKKGSVYGYKDQRFRQRCYPVNAVDTTAAGDTFTGFFLGSIMQGKGIREALDTAARASAIAVSRNGAGTSIPMLCELKNSDILFGNRMENMDINELKI